VERFHTDMSKQDRDKVQVILNNLLVLSTSQGTENVPYRHQYKAIIDQYRGVLLRQQQPPMPAVPKST
jgi:hypothetical protein